MFKIETKLSITDLIESPNIAEELTKQERDNIGHYAMEGFNADLQSRVQWEERMRDAMKLALQLKEEKTFPWLGCSNVKFPLITVAAIAFHSRIYPSLIQQPDIVHACVYGDDPDSQLDEAGQLIAQHMSWQIFSEDEDWEEEQDKLFLVESILGCAFKKSYFDRSCGRNNSELVLPSDLVVNYWAKDLDSAQRITHIRYISNNDIIEKERQGLYCEHDESYGVANHPELLGPLAMVRDQTQGTTPDTSDNEQPVVVLEQCCWMDLDNDGYKEPYVVTFRHDSNKVLRICAAFFEKSIKYNSKHQVEKITQEYAYTKYDFIPSPDGGFYSLGLGSLLGPLNKSIDTSINQLIDAGTMKNAGGGFLGRGVRVKGGEYTFRPGEWKRVDSTGEDLNKSVFPLPVGEPSAALLQLLQLLIQYGEKIAGATDTTSGENPGQNTKVGTMDSMVEQGLQVFSGIYKRNYRAMTSEFKKLFRLNQLYMNESQSFKYDGARKKIYASAYALPDTVIGLTADPNYMSDGQRQRQAQMVKGAAAQSNLYNPLEVERWFLKTMKVPGIDKILVKEVPPPSPPIQLQVEQLRMQAKMSELQAQQQEAQLNFRTKLLELTNEAELNQAKIIELQAKALLETEQAGTAQIDAEVAMINAQIGAARIHHESLLKSIKVLSDVVSNDKEKGHNAGKNAMENVVAASGNGSILPGFGGNAT
jgi:chaperonin GroES